MGYYHSIRRIFFICTGLILLVGCVSRPAGSNEVSEEKAERSYENDIKDITAYRVRTGRSMPSYSEMLNMNEHDFLMWSTVGVLEKNRDKFLIEMIEYEERTNNLDPPEATESLEAEQVGERILWKLFHAETSPETKQFLENLGSFARKQDEKHSSGSINISEIMLDKAILDYKQFNRDF